MKTDPVIISYYSNDTYYEDCAKALIGDCKKLGVEYHIEPVEFPPDIPWYRKCLYKLEYVAETARLLERPVLWIDVDSRLLSNPCGLVPFGVDFAAYRHDFLPQNVKRLTESRFWHPGITYYGATPGGRAFLEQMLALIKESPENVTDDYILQEGWERHGAKMRTYVIPPHTIQLGLSAPSLPEACILFKSSGNVRENVSKVVQHASSLAERHEEVLMHFIRKAMGRKAQEEAFHLARAAYLHPAATGESAVKLANLLSFKGETEEALEILQEAARKPGPGAAPAVKRLCEFAIQIKRPRLLDEMEALHSKEKSPESWGVIQANRAQMHLDALAAQDQWSSEERPAVWWMPTPYPGNFGDILTPYLIYRLYGIPVKWAPQAQAQALCIGSIARLAQPGMKIWGCGVARESDVPNPEAEWHAVRGPHTLRLLQAAGGKTPPAIGDPALLLPRAYQPKAVTKKGVVVIPHISQEDWLAGQLRLVSARFKGDALRVLSPRLVGFAAIERFIDELVSAEVVLSSSLHGVIAAHAYGIPARWMHLDEPAPQISGDKLKFSDYLETVGLKADPYIVAGDEVDVDQAVAGAEAPRCMPDLDALEQSFPFRHLQRSSVRRSGLAALKAALPFARR